MIQLKDDGYLDQEDIRSGEVSWHLDTLVDISEMTSRWISQMRWKRKLEGDPNFL